jgi:hypothetical protein
MRHRANLLDRDIYDMIGFKVVLMVVHVLADGGYEHSTTSCIACRPKKRVSVVRG